MMIVLIILGVLAIVCVLFMWLARSFKKTFERIDDIMDEPYEFSLYNKDTNIVEDER